MDRPKQKRVWIDKDIIDGPRCMFFTSFFTAGSIIFQKEEITELLMMQWNHSYSNFLHRYFFNFIAFSVPLTCENTTVEK